MSEQSASTKRSPEKLCVHLCVQWEVVLADGDMDAISRRHGDQKATTK